MSYVTVDAYDAGKAAVCFPQVVYNGKEAMYHGRRVGRGGERFGRLPAVIAGRRVEGFESGLPDPIGAHRNVEAFFWGGRHC